MLRKRDGVWQQHNIRADHFCDSYTHFSIVQVRRETKSKRPPIDIDSAITQTVKQLLTVVDAPMLIYKSPVGGRNENTLLAESLRLVSNQT